MHRRQRVCLDFNDAESWTQLVILGYPHLVNSGIHNKKAVVFLILIITCRQSTPE